MEGCSPQYFMTDVTPTHIKSLMAWFMAIDPGLVETIRKKGAEVETLEVEAKVAEQDISEKITPNADVD